MNNQECDILNALADAPFTSQRALAEMTGHSLGIVNRSIRSLTAAGYLDSRLAPTEQAMEAIRAGAPRSAVILAAGFGMRMVPINTEVPKGLLEVGGEPLIERLIRQLQEAGIREIRVVVGFMKEQYEYLIDQFGAELIVNAEYASKNNLHSLALAAGELHNTYIVPCDIWCETNPFRSRELYSWYMVSDREDPDSTVRVNRKLELVTVPQNTPGNAMVGIAYLMGADASALGRRLRILDADPRYHHVFWEEALYDGGRMTVPARVVPGDQAVEINTFEQLRELDSDSNQLKNEAIDMICRSLNTTPGQVRDITVLKKGMTNRSFLFRVGSSRYIMRIPGEGTDQLIDRRQEAAVYRTIDGLNICDDIAAIDPDSGYKITRFLEGARVCDPDDPGDLARCMEKLRSFHNLGLQVEHEFDIFGQLEFYESLWNGAKSAYKDYERTKQNVLSLRPFIQAHADTRVLTHIDAVPDNFLFVGDEVRLIDWEYAGMQDPHVDIAMFCIYSLYDRASCDRLIDLYFEGSCPRETRLKIYCYIAACGLLWSNWCEYKRALGVEFGEYSLRQYRYAKDYYRIVRDALGGMENA